MLTPKDIGLKYSDGHIITIKSLFTNNKIITQGEFEKKVCSHKFPRLPETQSCGRTKLQK